ncbi:MAG TPA: hypothetical protein VKB86_19265 [Pyrinomonadaceae bacterium]|nr:hypothetical protein [Pyrinomonadaceae bacterium]
MQASTTNQPGRRCSRYIAIFGLTASILFPILIPGGYRSSAQRPTGNRDKEQRQELRTDKTAPKQTRGAPYPAAKPSKRIPNEEQKGVPVPTGPKAGSMKPANPPFQVKQIMGRDGRKPEETQKLQHPQLSFFEDESDMVNRVPPPPLFFKDYHELTNSIPSTSGCCPEVSTGQNDQTIMMTGNDWMALSKNGGGSFSNINPTTIFPQVNGGFCCDQVIVYVPRIDMFVWLLQYWTGADGKNRIRLAAQTTPEVRSSNGTSWTYWDFVSDTFDTHSSLDYNDVAFGENSLWWTSQNGTGRVVVRIPLSEIAAKSTINFQYTAGTDALWSDLTQNATNTVYWAGHINNSQMRVYSMRDGDGFYSWRTVNINSWPNSTNSTQCPDGTDWMPFELNKHYVFGNALQHGDVWFSWLASAGGNFPRPHVQMVRISPSTWTLQEQVQVWNPTIAFQDAYLSTNNQGELGMEIAFGSGGFYPSSSVGVWGDFVVYYPRLSNRCIQRWGDYNHSRRAASNGADWVAGGYTNEKDSSGNSIVIPHYIRFGR